MELTVVIYAKLDVRMWSHKKFIKAGPAATGLWAAALAFLRENESSDGRIDDVDLGRLLSLGKGPALKLAKKLVECELFAKENGVHVLLKYAEKNETREEIQSRRDAAARRAKDWRSARNHSDRNGVTNELPSGQYPHVTPLPTVHALGVTAGSGSGYGSGSGSLGGSGGAVRLTDPLPDELREAARVIGLPDGEVGTSWAAFTGHHDGQILPSVAGYWQRWVSNDVKRLRSGPRKANGRANGALIQQDPPEPGAASWTPGRVITGGSDGH